MQPLIRISSVPINMEIRTQRAELRKQTEQPRANVTRSRGNAFIQTTPAQVRIDTFETRASAGLRSAPRSVRDFAEAGREAAMQATREIAEQGNHIVDSRGRGNPVVEIIQSRVNRTADTIMAFIPSVPPQITVDEGSISFDFTMDRINYDWSAIRNRPEVEFVPGEIEFVVHEFPQVIIEFLGGPIYVPPSAAPNYEPIPGVSYGF